MFVKLFLAISLVFFGLGAAGADQVSQWRQAHEQQIMDQFAELHSIPNVASDKVNIRRNIDLISKMLAEVGMQVELLELEGSNPVVFAERSSPGATKAYGMRSKFMLPY